MKVYRLSRSFLIFLFSVLGLMTLIGGSAALLELIRSYPSRLFEVWFLGVWLGLLGWAWYAYLTIPFEIRMQTPAAIEFRSVLKQTALSLDEIKAIQAMPLSPGFIKLKHTTGTIHLINQMDGFHEFLSTLKTLNPAIEIKGC